MAKVAYTKNPDGCSIESFDGTTAVADALVAAYPSIVSIQDETVPTAVILLVYDNVGQYQNAYAGDCIVFNTDGSIDVQVESAFLLSWTVKPV